MPEGENAAEGKRLHRLAANWLAYDEPLHADDEDRRIVEPYVNDTLDRHTELDGGQLLIERRVCGAVFPDGGVPDAMFSSVQHRTLVISDLKTGYTPVYAKENIQLLMYAIELQPPDDWTVELRIIQPNVRDTADVWQCAASDLATYRDMILQRIDEARNNPRLVATPNNCTYCSAVTSCEAARGVTLGGMDIALRETGKLPGSAIRSELVTLRTAKDLITTRLDALEAEAEARIRDGEAIDGCAIVPGRAGKLAWTADKAQIESYCELAGVDPMKHSLITPKQALDAGVPAEVIEVMAERRPAKATIDTESVDRMFPDD